MKKSELVAQVAAGIKSKEEASKAEIKETKKESKKEKKAKKQKEEALVPVNKSKEKDKAIIKEVTPINKASLIQEVISHREVKYIYPDDIEDTLSRKAFRQKVRNQLNKLEMAMLKIKDQESKEFKKAKKAYNEYKAQFIKEAV